MRPGQFEKVTTAYLGRVDVWGNDISASEYALIDIDHWTPRDSITQTASDANLIGDTERLCELTWSVEY